GQVFDEQGGNSGLADPSFSSQGNNLGHVFSPVYNEWFIGFAMCSQLGMCAALRQAQGERPIDCFPFALSLSKGMSCMP
ncbi:MAG: hypothetical protein KKD53_04220, partial [Proteobacteria bacterium]|nr:hypothetical protein [Pseudomonadota bacterium]